MAEITVNAEQKLYVIPTGSGYSCLGFDVAFSKAVALADAIAKARPDLAERALDQKPDAQDCGTISVYNAYQNLVSIIARENVDIGTFYSPDTHPEVKRQLELARKGGYRLKIELGDRETGQAWSDRADSGTISRSMGPIKIPLLIKRRTSMGGEGILTDSIVKISDTPGGRVLWQHPDYKPYVEREAAPAA